MLNLTNQEKNLIEKYRNLNIKDQGGANFHFENFLIEQYIKDQAINYHIKQNNKLDDEETELIQVYRKLNPKYKKRAEKKLDYLINQKQDPKDNKNKNGIKILY